MVAQEIRRDHYRLLREPFTWVPSELLEKLPVASYGCRSVGKTPAIVFFAHHPEVAGAHLIDLDTQMHAQTPIVNYLAEQLEVERTVHAGLVPQSLVRALAAIEYPVITWEQILTAYEGVAGDDYFLGTLRYALKHHDVYLGAGTTFGRNAESHLTGQQIIDMFSSDAQSYATMGRSGGLFGPRLAGDIASGHWQEQSYEVRTAAKPINPNWFRISDFVQKLTVRGQAA